MDAPGTVTEVLRGARAGDRAAVDLLFTLLYDELQGVAHRQLRGQPAGRTLDTAALIHEAWLRMVDQTRAEWPDRAHFFAYAARAMRSILVDYARRRNTARRGGGVRHVTLDGDARAIAEQADLIVALDDALLRLAQQNERLSRTVECRFFGGLTEPETAEVLGVSERTVRRDWMKARAWLYSELGDSPFPTI